MINFTTKYEMLVSVVLWLAYLTTIPEITASIRGYVLDTFLEIQYPKQGSHSLVRTIGQLLGMSSEIQLRKLIDTIYLTTPCTTSKARDRRRPQTDGYGFG